MQLGDDRSKVFITRGTISKKYGMHTFVRVSDDETHEGSHTVARKNGYHGAMSNKVLCKT